MARHQPPLHNIPPEMDKKRRNYKLLADPMLDHSKDKVYRFDGANPHVSVVIFLIDVPQCLLYSVFIK
jgi:hypothetical protein